MRYRLRTLLICISLLGVVSAVAGWLWRRNLAEQQAVQTLALHRARFDYRDSVPFGALGPWVDARLGREFRSDVSTVHVDDSEANHPDVVLVLKRLPALECVKVACWRGEETAAAQLKSDMHGTPVEVQVEYNIW